MGTYYYAPDRETGFGHAVYRQPDDSSPAAEKVSTGLTADQADAMAKRLNKEALESGGS